MNKSFKHIPKEQRKKIVLVCDDIRVHSGVATVAKEIVVHTAHHFNWVNLGGAVKHPEAGQGFDLSPEILSGMMVFAQPIAKAIEKVFPCNRCGISVVGLEVPHAHMHLVPINSSDDLNFTRGKLSLSQTELQSVQQSILLQLGS